MTAAADMKPSEALRKARDLIIPEGAWIKGAYAKTKSGRVIGPREASSACWCSKGSLRKVTDDNIVIWMDAEHFLRQVTMRSIPSWNDDEDRTHAEVLDTSTQATALAEAEGR